MSNLLRSLTKNERIACFFQRIAYLLIFLQKTSGLLRKPMGEFPTLVGTMCIVQALTLSGRSRDSSFIGALLWKFGTMPSSYKYTLLNCVNY